MLLKELSFAQCVVLEVLVAALVYLLGSDGSLMGGVLPLWATAAGMSGLAVAFGNRAHGKS